MGGRWRSVGLPFALVSLLLVCGCSPQPGRATSTSPTSGSPTPESAAATISGFVFRDLNADGTREAREPGEMGITVSAYDADDTLVASTTTDAAGNYVLNAELEPNKIVQGQEYAVVFSGLPEVLVSGPQGRDSGTELQFVVGGASNVNYGVFNPDQYTVPKKQPGTPSPTP